MKKLIAKLFRIKICTCVAKIVCDHIDTAVRKEVKYCSCCKTILNEG
jgi:hypothetical protein